jgi:uncharacterized membrane protein (DUF4010 family)
MPIDLITKIQPFVIAIALGLLIGIERERSHPPGLQAIGLRSFVLLSLLGALAAYIKDPYFTVGITFFVAAVIIAGYLRSSHREKKHPDIGVTTEVGGIVTYTLGYLAYQEPFIALMLGVAVLLILMGRTRLHDFSRKDLHPEEVRAAVVLLILGIGIIPFLPNQLIDPWHVFNPRHFGALVLVILLLQFSAYVGIRLFGNTKGVILSGFLAGFVSSTTATVNLTRAVKNKVTPYLVAASAIILATVGMYLQILMIVFIASPQLLQFIAGAFLVSIIASALIALGIAKFSIVEDHYPVPKNPLSLKAAIELAAFLAGMLIIVTLSERWLGTIGSQVVVFLGGLVGIQGVILAIASLYHQGTLSAIQSMNNIGIAVLASFISKFVIIWTVLRPRHAIIITLLLLLMVIIFIICWLSVSISLI